MLDAQDSPQSPNMHSPLSPHELFPSNNDFKFDSPRFHSAPCQSPPSIPDAYANPFCLKEGEYRHEPFVCLGCSAHDSECLTSEPFRYRHSRIVLAIASG